MAEKIMDPSLVSELTQGPAPEQVTDPATLRDLGMSEEQIQAKLTDYKTQGLIGSEPSMTERFTKGLVRPITGAMELGSHLLPAGEKPEKKPEREGVVKAPKLPQRHLEGFDPVEELGAIVSPTPIYGPVAKGMQVASAALKSPAIKGATGPVLGALAGGLEPVPEGTTDFWHEKATQAGTGFGFGFGMTLGGKAVSRGMEAIGNYMLRAHPDTIMSTAVQKVLDTIQRDTKHGGMSAKDAIDLIDNTNIGRTRMIGGVPQPMRMADIGNLEEGGSAGIRDLAGYVARKPGESKAIARAETGARDLSAPDRLDQALSQYVTSGPSVYEAAKVLSRQRSAAARPAYEALDNVQGIWSPRLQEFLENPRVKLGLRHGYEDARDQALAENRPFNPHAWGVDLDIDGNIKLLQVPNMHVLDMAKRGLDKMVSNERDNLTGKLSADGRTYDMIRHSFIDEIDSLDTKGLYRKARAAWAGPSASLDALRQGKILFHENPEEISAYFNQLSSTDKEFYKLGVADMIRERLGKTGFSGDDAKQVIKNPWMRKQLRPIFKDEQDFNEFSDVVARESTMFRTKEAAFGGSQTGERLLSDVDTQGNLAKSYAMHGAAALLHGGIRGTLRAAGDMYRLHRVVGMMPDPKMNEAVAKILFSPEGTRLLTSPPVAATAQTHSPRLMQAGRNVEDISGYLGAAAGTEAGGTKSSEPMPKTPPAVTRYDAQGNRIPGRAEGGEVEAGKRYVVGERGPEVMVPQRSGTVVPSGFGEGAGVLADNDLRIRAMENAASRRKKAL